MSDYKNILYRVENGTAHITLDRPEKRNALSFELLTELNAALWEADDDKQVHAVLLSGAGACFSSGYDLSPAARAQTSDASERRGGNIYADPTIDDDIWRLERSQRLRMIALMNTLFRSFCEQKWYLRSYDFLIFSCFW